jgi:hypothetical protein
VGSYSDAANAICIDHSGNIYVTGGEQIATGYQCTTIKYSSSGSTYWIRSFSLDDHSLGFDVSVDNTGNVFVAGAGCAIKYDSLGNFLWARYDSVNFSKIELDTSGNIYASGIGYGNMTTVKYNKYGTRLWKKTGAYNVSTLSDMELDKSGNVIITGSKQYSATNYDYITVKYSDNGNISWVRNYNGPSSNSIENAYALSTDDSGNVYVTGSSTDASTYFICATIKYDSSGNIIWVNRIYPPAVGYDIAVDEFQNVYIASRSDGYNYTTKLDKNANILWQRDYPTTDMFATNISRIILDSVNDIYISINTDTMSITHYGVVKYTNNGDRVFVGTYIYSLIASDYVRDMIIDKKGNIFLTGKSSTDFATVKFSEIVTSTQSTGFVTLDFKLHQNYPNPFNPTTTIRFDIRTSGNVSLKVYDVLGREVAVLADEYLRAGSYERVFEASNLSSGVYFYTLRVTSGQALRADEFEKTLRMVVVR